MLTEVQILTQIEHWGKVHLYPDLHRFERNGEENVRIWIEPYYGLEKRNPPLSFQTIILDNLIKIFHSWRSQFEHLQRPYDLQLVLFEEAFIRSEVNAVRVSRMGKKHTNGFHPAREIKRFPYEQFFENRKQLRDFEWQMYWEGEYLHPGLDDLNVLEIEQCLANGFQKEWPTGRKDPGNYLLFKPTDRVWVGRWIL